MIIRGALAEKPFVDFRQRETEDQKIRQRVADQNRPQKFFRLFQKIVQQLCRWLARARQPPHAQPVQREHARLHARQQKRKHQRQNRAPPN